VSTSAAPTSSLVASCVRLPGLSHTFRHVSRACRSPCRHLTQQRLAAWPGLSISPRPPVSRSLTRRPFRRDRVQMDDGRWTTGDGRCPASQGAFARVAVAHVPVPFQHEARARACTLVATSRSLRPRRERLNFLIFFPAKLTSNRETLSPPPRALSLDRCPPAPASSGLHVNITCGPASLKSFKGSQLDPPPLLLSRQPARQACPHSGGS
jgi:hypothetical protein